MKRIQIDQDIQQFLLSRGVELGESASSILRRELHLEEPPGTIEIDDDVYSFLVSRVQTLGESASSILRRELHLASAPGPPSPAPVNGVVEFHIPPGTGGGPWNTRDAPVVATVGNTLRLVNDDSVPHRPHTTGVPFPHAASDIAPGQSADFVLTETFDSPNQPITDHLFGPGAQFFLVVRPAQ